jgi:hypothetical protein
MTTTNNQLIANEILNQLGGRKFLVMTGSKNLFFDNNENGVSLRMDLTRNNANVNRLKITLNANDTYTMEFYKMVINRKNFEIKISNEERIENVYNEMLQSVFTDKTGLLTKV